MITEYYKNSVDGQKGLEVLKFELDRVGLSLNDGKVSLEFIKDEDRKKRRKNTIW